MQGSFQKVSFPRILRVEKFKEVENERLVYVSFCEVNVKIGTFHESEEKFIDDL
jgi:hypothetical protein